jgi:hypothetical protein
MLLVQCVLVFTELLTPVTGNSVNDMAQSFKQRAFQANNSLNKQQAPCVVTTFNNTPNLTT